MNYEYGAVDAKVSLFFDRDAVLRYMDKVTRKAMSKFGANVRQRAMTSMPKTDKVSRPGSPPSDHLGLARKRWNKRRKAEGKAPMASGFRGLRHILFAYEPSSAGVVIGPIARRGIGVVPPLLEYGGVGRFWSSKDATFKTGTYRPRPFMGPAFTEEQKTLPAIWDWARQQA